MNFWKAVRILLYTMALFLFAINTFDRPLIDIQSDTEVTADFASHSDN